VYRVSGCGSLLSVTGIDDVAASFAAMGEGRDRW
jgi:hypothetical protein